MIVYGDSEREERPAAVLAAIKRDLETYLAQPDGIEAHSLLVGAFIAASEVVQGIADAERTAAGGVDIDGFGQQAGAALLLLLAGQIADSWRNGLRPTHRLQPGWQQALTRLDVDTPLRMRHGEGYLHYALYPESYLDAAQASGLGPDTTVIGLRSIGTGLAAMVAAGIGAARFHTLRPHGHPFDRQVTMAEPLAEALLAGSGPVAIVDEGPGKSGSSFGGVADWLEAHGVARERIHFFPSHSGEPGAEAKPDHRQRWRIAPKHPAGYSGTELAAHLTQRLPALVGPLAAPLREISGGGWRSEDCTAPADRQMERLKFIAETERGRFLIKFAGLGDTGRRKLGQGQALADFVPAPVGLLHGFLVEPWIEGTSLWEAPFDRAAFLQAAADYLAARARLLPAPATGAALNDLEEMARINIGERLGEPAAERLTQKLAGIAEHTAPLRPIYTDNRLQPWEWLLTADGRFLKTDALDHASSHDLIGPQDITWDIAGLAVEFDLTDAELEQVATQVSSRSGGPVDPTLLSALQPCYAAFQIGLWTDAEARAEGTDRARIAALLARYTDHARRLLAKM